MMEEQEKVLLRDLCLTAPLLVHFADNVSSDNMAGYFEKYFKGVYIKRVELLHSAGIACAVHLDGVIKPVIRDLCSTGLDAVEALTPAPGGDQEVENIRSLAGSDSVILWGGVPGIMFSPPYGWEQLEAHVKRVLECWSGTPFILGVADQVPAVGDVSFVRKISNMLEEEQQ